MNKKSNYIHGVDTSFWESKSLKLKIAMLLIGFFSLSNVAFAQKSISGVITDNQGALPGANILIKGTNVGTSTDFDGFYEITTVSQGDILVFSSMGMVTQEITVGTQVKIDIYLEEDMQALDEVVVMGYTTTTRKNVASSVSKLDTKELLGMATVDVQQAVQGKISGVQVTSNGGDPGSGSKMVIRGAGSFSNTEPLYVIDGIQGGDINSIPQASIESITILKDAATTAIYGSAGANGVVVITTKNGTKGKVKIEYDGSVGMATFNKRYDMLNTSDYIDMVEDIQGTLTDKLEGKDPKYGVLTDKTDWQDEIFQTAYLTDHSIRVSGGSEAVRYAFSTGYQKRESTVKNRDYERINLGLKLNEKLFNNYVTLGQNIRLKKQKYTGVPAQLVSVLGIPNYVPIYDKNNLGGYARTDIKEDLTDANNPLNAINNTEDYTNTYSVDVELYFQVKLYEGLKFKTQGRYSASAGDGYSWEDPSNKSNILLEKPIMYDNYSTWSRYFFENFFMYNTEFGDHSINATLGNTIAPPDNSKSIRLKGSEFTSSEVHNIGLANNIEVQSTSVNSGKARESYFGSLGYVYKNRYVLNGSLRMDASSVFGENNRWGTFYGIGSAWTISEEEFMENSIFSVLKLRASYGKTGNDNIPGNLTSSTVWKGRTSGNIVYPFADNENYSQGSTINSVPNPDLKWEETVQFDIGLDMGLMDDRLSFELDYYNRNNDDLLIQTLLPESTGLGFPAQSPSQWVNAASMINYGVEFTAGYSNDRSSDFKWNISANASYNHNEITKLGTVGDIPIISGQFQPAAGPSTRTDIGHSLGAFYGYKIDRITRNKTDVKALDAAAKIASGGKIKSYQNGLSKDGGDYIWQDIDGNGYIDENDQTYLGNSAPTYQFGATFNADYKGFDFQIFFQGVADVSIVNANRYWTEGMSRPFNSTTEVLGRWTEDNNNAENNFNEGATMHKGGTENNLVFSDWYVEDGDYVRIKNIALGYTFDQSLFYEAFTKFRIYGSIQNLYTLTKYSGYDPEISTNPNFAGASASTFARGIDNFNRPNPTTYRVGIQLNF